ncbi:MAG TPA: hypothetical protein VGL56_06385 [Fimbriimonadaceae bacterium]
MILVLFLAVSTCAVGSVQELQPAVSSILSGLPVRCVGPRSNARFSVLAVFDKYPKLSTLAGNLEGFSKPDDGSATSKAVFDN